MATVSSAVHVAQGSATIRALGNTLPDIWNIFNRKKIPPLVYLIMVAVGLSPAALLPIVELYAAQLKSKEMAARAENGGKKSGLA